MARLPKFTLSHNEEQNRWDLIQDKSNLLVATFETKADATKGGVLDTAVGQAGGSVKIQKLDGKFQEERTFPRAADPKRSPG